MTTLEQAIERNRQRDIARNTRTITATPSQVATWKAFVQWHIDDLPHDPTDDARKVFTDLLNALEQAR
jgi:hypothetical protein